ncbi:MAG: hypothetical protein RLZZ127_768, partial [Planctomycetota bacterium]
IPPEVWGAPPQPLRRRLTAAERSTLTLALGALVAVLAATAWLAARPRTALGAVPTWDGIAPPLEQPLAQWKWIVIHHSAGASGDTQAIDRHHEQANRWDGIGYHFVIGNGDPMPVGGIEATFRWRGQRPGAHAGPGAEQRPYNQLGIGICLVGDYSARAPDPLLERRTAELCAVLVHQFPSLSLTRIIRHGEVPGKQTACPGRVDIERIRFLARQHLERQGWSAR